MANAEKGARYLGQLDQALCSGNWSEIQELARKTDKHAPERTCLTLTARSEAQIASASHRPTSASSAATSSIHGLSELVPKLAEAINVEKKFPEDSYAARVCLAEINWLREDPGAAVQALAHDGIESRGGGSHVTALGWMEVCDVKSTLIKVASLESTGKEDEARQQYLSAALKAPGSRTPELRRWTERLLARGCMFTRQRAASSPTIQSLSESLRCFQAWTDFWQRAPAPTGGSNTSPSHLDIPRRKVWKAYYDLLSTILQHGLMYNPSSTSPSDLLMVPSDDTSNEQYTSAKLRQRAALHRVEATYESLLLNETHFPKASQTNTEVEEWTEQVVSNWRVLCTPEWTDAEIGAGGKEGVGRGVLEILYRAATKTFHSTAILRYLFTVHAALGEFDLAMHAFNSFMELVDKAKARAEKTGKHELGFENNESVILAAVEAVRILCRYGDTEQAETAVEVAKTIQKWLDQDLPSSSEDANTSSKDNPVSEGPIPNQRTQSHLQMKTVGAAYRSVAISKAHWACKTYETESRSGLQSEALRTFRRAQECDEDNIETAYALALLLAETRDVDSAAGVIKQTIASSSNDEEDEDEDEDAFPGSDDYTRERRLVPMWHLLALCLTAKDDYEQAAKMCEVAFQQFGDSTVLFGEDSDNRVSNDSEKPHSRSSGGIVDQMDGFEKEGIIQVKMSQVALIEVMEGAGAAVDVSSELLALYARLFGNPELVKTRPMPPQTATSTTPSKFGGTIRSLAGSIRPRSIRNSGEKDDYTQGSVWSGPVPKSTVDSGDQRGTANGQNMGVPIAITVTNEDGVATEKSHHNHHFPFKLRGQHGDWRDHGNLKGAKSAGSMREKPAPISEERAPRSQPNAPKIVGAASHANRVSPVRPAVANSMTLDGQASPDQPLKEVAHNVPHDTWPPPPGHRDQPPRQDVRLPAPLPTSSALPEPRLPSSQDRQHRISLLVEIWLFIASLYLRADLFDDAEGAIIEANKLVESFEIEVGAEHSSARRFFEKGWAGGKSVDQLWADFWAAKAEQASARAQPFAAMSAFEQSLAHFPDHPEGIIGLSNILMDIYEEKIPAEEPRPLLQSTPSVPGSTLRTAKPSSSRPALASKNTSAWKTTNTAPNNKSANQDPTPAELNRLASRDRAYMLLSTLTRLGSGWDNSEAWYTLARAHELSKQVGKAKQALWWVVELEENRPMRPWREVSPAGFAL